VKGMDFKTLESFFYFQRGLKRQRQVMTRKIEKTGKEDLKRRKILVWVLGLAAFVLMIVYFTLFGIRTFYRHFGFYFLKTTETHWPAKSKESIRALLGPTKGKVVWGSSRTGSHQIFLMTLPELTIYQLTRHPHVDYHPRFSPEGNRIVFARSQKKWVSEREQIPWDVYLYDLEKGKEKLAARNGNFPLWLPDGQRILFLRDHQVVIKDLASQRERVIFDGRLPPFEGEPSNPELYPDNPELLAVALRGKHNGVFLIELSKSSISIFGRDACEITWLPGTSQVVWVEVGGKGGTLLMASPFQRVERRIFMDLPLSFSHEYFPRFSRDGQWLIWGASEGEHEHDLADYEIFLWKVGTPWNAAVRLTFNKANDRFPDIFIEKGR
jgi:Tol biopolymer transport system component